MDNEQKLRIKSAMIVYALESSLGSYVIKSEVLDNFSEKTKEIIIERELSKGRDISKDSISHIVEASYLDEIFALAIDATGGSSLEPHMRNLKAFCSFLGIFDIRNAVSHSNRPFPDFYWFRVAAIASDPLILKLGLVEVHQALNSAIAEILNTPPDEWMNNVKWAIPNSLPTSFDHEITGLLGREQGFKDLETTMSKARNSLIAVVAPGGIGKTALILQFLREISLSPNWTERINSIIFCTLKNERLTSNGIEIIEAIDGIDQVKNSIFKDLSLIYNDKEFSSFEDACEKLSSQKVLICIDNLETLLIHSQAEFIEFNQSLPLLWKVIVTSRISIDSATTVPLEPLGKRHAVTLCRYYLRKRGVSEFKQETLELIAQKANNNPLAIRLTIDLYIRGVDISQSIQQSQKDIASFSYKNLIESLQPNSISMLEAIYVIGDSTKSQLMDLLELSNEEIAEAINELTKTSLIVRTTSESGNDKFNLSDSIRDLLLTNPKNIEVRSRISDGMKERRNKILEQVQRNQKLGLTEFDEEYVPAGTDSTVHVLIADLNKHLSKSNQKKSHEKLIQFKNRFIDLLSYNNSNYQLYYHYSRVLKELKDFSGEVQMLTQARKLKYDSPRCALAIALSYFNAGKYNEAKEIFEGLKDRGYDIPNNSTKRFSFSITKLYLLCLLYLGEYDVILEKTMDWQKDPNWSVLLGTYRASTLKRSIEHQKDDSQIVEKALLQTFEVFDLIFKVEDYAEIACVEAYKIIKEVSSYYHSYSKLRLGEKFTLKYLYFVANHYLDIVSVVRDASIESYDSRVLLKRLYSLDIGRQDNPLHTARWYIPETGIYYDQEHIKELIENGFDIVSIYHIPDNYQGMPNFMFARNENNDEFYLHVEYFEGGWNRWGYLRMNQKLGIKHEGIVRNGKSTPAIWIVEIDQYAN